MIPGLSIVFVTALTFQNPPVDGLRNANIPTNPPPADQKITPELRGDIFMARKMYRDAIDMYKQGPETAVLANKTGIAYHLLLDFNSAKKCYQRAIKLNPKYPEAINNLGTVYYAQKSYRRAIKEYKKALQVSPDSASILSNLGTAYLARKKYEIAFATYQQALQLDPDVFEHRGSTGVLLEERTVQERAKYHYYLAKTYAKAGDNDRAIEYIRKALEEGFKDREKFEKEPEFAGLQKDPEFIKLMETEQKVL
ncbi:MAG: tetratricopeptide repeat protein [Bryobacteraceae bacterium]